MKKYAFTLVEVLVALVIIGVIAILIIPMMLGGTNEQEIATAKNKVLSAAGNALELDYSLYGNNADGDNYKLAKMLKNHLSVVDDLSDDGLLFRVSDGMIYNIDGGFDGYSFLVDVNGEKGNGILEEDVFRFYIDGRKIVCDEPDIDEEGGIYEEPEPRITVNPVCREGEINGGSGVCYGSGENSCDGRDVDFCYYYTCPDENYWIVGDYWSGEDAACAPLGCNDEDCESCSGGYEMSNSSCVRIPDNCYDLACTSCYSGYESSNGSCEKIPKGCSNLACTSCAGGYNFSNNNCTRIANNADSIASCKEKSSSTCPVTDRAGNEMTMYLVSTDSGDYYVNYSNTSLTHCNVTGTTTGSICPGCFYCSPSKNNTSACPAGTSVPTLSQLNDLYQQKGTPGVPTTGCYWAKDTKKSGSYDEYPYYKCFNNGSTSYVLDVSGATNKRLCISN